MYRRVILYKWRGSLGDYAKQIGWEVFDVFMYLQQQEFTLRAEGQPAGESITSVFNHLRDYWPFLKVVEQAANPISQCGKIPILCSLTHHRWLLKNILWISQWPWLGTLCFFSFVFFPSWLLMLSIFSCAHWPFVLILWRAFCHYFLPASISPLLGKAVVTGPWLRLPHCSL